MSVDRFLSPLIVRNPLKCMLKLHMPDHVVQLYEHSRSRLEILPPGARLNQVILPVLGKTTRAVMPFALYISRDYSRVA